MMVQFLGASPSRALALTALLGACSPRAVDTAPALDVDAATTMRRCVDATGASAPCAVAVTTTPCPNTSAADCAVLALEELRAGVDGGGACLHLVIANRCGRTMYSDTCIEHTSERGPEWQCWRSSTSAGGSVDVGQCNATGRYHRYSSVSRGEVDILQTQCPHP